MTFAVGILVVIATGCSLVIGTLAAAAALIRSCRDERTPVPPNPACRPCAAQPEPDEEACWWIDPAQLNSIADVMVAYGVTTVAERQLRQRRGAVG